MNGKMRAGLSLLLCLVLCLGTAGAAESRDLTSQEGQAIRLERLGLFLGVGEDENGFTDFDLDRTPSREEAVTMLVRALGKGTEAAEMGKTHPFTDVPAWADGYVSYAYDQGLTKGTSDTAFGAGDTATGAMYVTFMLRALGYADGTDFTWDDPWALAEDCGILPERVDREAFLRADAVDVTAAALSAKRKGTDATLAQKLIEEGAISQAAWDQAFQTYEAAMAGLTEGVMPFVIEERWDSSYGTVLLGQYTGTPHAASPALRLVTKAAAAVGEGLVINLPMLEQGIYTDTRPDQLSLSQDGRTFAYSFHFDEDTTVMSLSNVQEGMTYQAGTYVYTADLNTGKVSRSFTPLEQPSTGTEAGQDAYEAAVDALTQGKESMPVTVLDRLESDLCTVLSLRTDGLPRGSVYSLRLVYKDGSAKGAGETVDLPLTVCDGMGIVAQAENLTLSADGKTLTYTCTVPKTVLSDPGDPASEVIRAAGTYTYTVDLATGDTSEAFQAAPEPTPEEEQAAYDAAIAQRTQGVTVLERLESDNCTVLYTSASDAKGERLSLILVFKPGSARGAGETTSVGLPSITETIQAAPEDLAISADGKTLTFTCTVDELSTGQQVSTYHYTIPLDTGSVQFEVTT